MSTRRLPTAALAACLAIAGAAHADDTDIYLNPALPGGGEPLVMFNIDYRSNLGSVSCNLGAATVAAIAACGYSEDIIDTLGEDNAHSDAKISLFELIRAALTNVIAPLGGVRVGLMMSHGHNSNCEGPGRVECSNGGMIMLGFTSVTTDEDIDDFSAPLNGKARFRQVLRQIPATPGIAGLPDYHPYQIKETYFELFRYLTGQGVYNGRNGWRDFDSSNAAKVVNLDGPEAADPGFNVDGIFNYPGWDTSIITGGGSGANYISPLIGGNCSRVFVINVGFGTANQDNDSDAAIAATKASGGLNLNLSGSNTQAQLFQFLNDADLGDGTWGTVPLLDGKQNVTSYFLMQSANNTQNEWALGGGTGAAVELGGDPDVITGTISNIFKSILAVSTTFVAPSVPVNVFNRSQTLNEVFLALFEADDIPAWPGNLKKLVIGTNALGDLELQDASTPPIGAIDVDGRIKREAITYWTDAAALPPANDDEVGGADGRAIKRGGAGQKIPGFLTTGPGTVNSASTRRLFLDDAADSFNDGVADGLMPLEVTNQVRNHLFSEVSASFTPAQAALAGGDQNIEVDNILRYARGLKPDGTTREWLLGDPLHSRPLPINYGARAAGFDANNPDIRILMGTNDGYMHMFQNTDASGVQSGRESWAFMPRPAMAIQNRLYREETGAPSHPATTDGSPVALLVDGNFDGSLTSGAGTLDKAIAMFGQRRGGPNLYALDILDPDNPSLAWRILGGTGSFVQLTQTWSPPQIGRVRIGSPVATPTNVIAFGGGYNGDNPGTGTFAACNGIAPGTDVNPNDGIDDRVACFQALGKDAKNRANREGAVPLMGEDDNEGNAIFLVNAETGALVWKFVQGPAGVDTATKTTFHPELRDSIPAEVVLIDTSGNGISDRMYVADTGGSIWRVDLAGLFDADADPSTPDVLVTYEPSVWQITRLLTIGRHDITHVTIDQDRRFFNRVDVVQSRDGVGPFDGLLIGSGDREDPQASTVVNWFYLVKDRHITSGLPPTTEPGGDPLPMEEDDLPDLTSNCLQTGTLAACGIANLDNGWRIRLTSAGEKNLAASVTAGGVVFFTTFEPSPPAGACGLSEGVGRLYALALDNATAVINFDSTNDTNPPPGQTVTFERSDTLGSGGIPVEVVPIGQGKILVQGQEAGENIVNTGAKSNLRTYWHERF